LEFPPLIGDVTVADWVTEMVDGGEWNDLVSGE